MFRIYDRLLHNVQRKAENRSLVVARVTFEVYRISMTQISSECEKVV